MACKGGLYPLPPPTSKFRKLVFNAIRIFLDHWHNRLGHPGHDIVLRIIRDNNLPCASLDYVATAICDSCLHAKACQLPYSMSTSRAAPPLELIHSNVWVLQFSHLVIKNIILALSTIITNSHGFICYIANLKFFSTS
jgi:hypothetical protein